MWGLSGYNSGRAASHHSISERVMTTMIEIVFENGVFRPLFEADFKENQRYALILEDLTTKIVDQPRLEWKQTRFTRMRRIKHGLSVTIRQVRENP
jgi:predicted DNA-binding antitoxin AbrB/MazE fold protein